MTTSPPSTSEIRAALGEPSVVRAVARAVRDARMRASFDRMRGEGVRAEEAVERLRGPHQDVQGRAYYLSEEGVRSVVYRRNRAGGRMEMRLDWRPRREAG